MPPRLSSGIAEFDRALGGGLVAGSATLIGGDPGIGKSTLLLQAAAKVAAQGLPVAYISGEEAADQIRLRARRLGLGAAPLRLAAATSVRDILTTLAEEAPPALVVIDSIQTMYSDLIEGAPGHGEPGPRRRARADPLRQGERRGAGAGRPCHQGRRDRRAARARAYGRYGAELRRRAKPSISHPARHQEPLWRHRRDRRVRDGRRGAGRGRQPVGPVPHRPGRGGAGRGGLPGAGGDTASAGRDPGAHRPPRQRRHAAPGGGRLGFGAAGDDPRRAGGALRPQLLDLPKSI